MFLEDNKKTIQEILIDKEEEIMHEKSPIEDKNETQERIPNMKRKVMKYHSHVIENVGGLQKNKLRIQKSGSVTFPSALEIPIGKFLLKNL